MTINFSDNVGHLFAQDVYTSMPIGYQTFENPYIFWVDNEYTNYLSINNYYVKLIRLVVDEEPETIDITIDSDIFSLISPQFFAHKTNDIKIDQSDIKKQLTNNDLYAIEVDGQYLIPFYVCAYSKEEGTWVSNALININNSCFCPITVGAQIKNEQEELIINGKNMGVNLPKNIINAVYQGSTYNAVYDETLYNEKLKEYLINYMGIRGECGNYRSAKASLDWFGWGDKISLSQLLRINNDFHESYIRDQFSIDNDILESYKYFRTSTYLTLQVKENVEVDDDSLRGQIHNNYYTENDLVVGKNGKTYDKTTYNIERVVSSDSKEAFEGMFAGYVNDKPKFYKKEDLIIGLNGYSYDRYTYAEHDIETGYICKVGDRKRYINNDHSFWGEWKPKMQSLFDMQKDVVYEQNVNENVIYKRNYYDFIYDDLALKISLLARYYETYFLPIHLNVHSATIEHQCHTNDIKLSSFYNGQHISNGVNMVSDKGVKVIFPDENELLLYKQEHIIDEQYNIFHKSKNINEGNKTDCVYDENEEVYEINDDKCDVYVDDICCQLPIRILPTFNLNNKNVLNEINSYQFTPIKDNDSYRFVCTDYSKYFKCAIVLSRLGKTIFNSLFNFVFKGNISKQFECNDCLIYNENNELVKIAHNKLTLVAGNFYYNDKQVNPCFDYITIYCKDDNQFIVPGDYKFSTESGEQIRADELIKNNKIIITQSNNVINNAKFAENNIYEVIYTTRNLIDINIETVSCDYDSFLIVPRYFKQFFDATFWYDKDYGIELCVNDNWYHYDFKMKVPKFIVNVGTLQYRDIEDVDFSQYIEDKYTDDDLQKVNDITYIKSTLQNGRPTKKSIQANKGDKKLTLNIPIMAEPELVAVANKNFYSLMNKNQDIADIDNVVNKYWEEFYIPNHYKNLNYVIYCNIYDKNTNAILKYTDKGANIQEEELKRIFFNDNATCKLSSSDGLWRGNNAQLFDIYLMHDKKIWWLVLISKKNVNSTKYDMYLHFDGFINHELNDVVNISEDEAYYINDVKVYYIQPQQKFVALYNGQYIDKWYNSNLYNNEGHITYNRSYVYNNSIYMFNVVHNELQIISNDISISDLFTTELITNKYYDFDNFRITGFSLHNKLLINRLQFTNVKNNRYIFGNDDIIVAKLMGSNNDLLFNMDHTNKWEFKNIDINPNNVYETNSTTNIGILSLDRYKSTYKSGYYTVQARYNIDDVTDHQQTSKITFRIEDRPIENYDYANNDIIVDDGNNIDLKNYSISIGDMKNIYDTVINYTGFIGSLNTITIKKYPNNAHASFVYESSDNNVLTIGANGQFTLNAIGNASITIRAKDGDGNIIDSFIDPITGEEINASRTINVNVKLDNNQLYYFISGASINTDIYNLLDDDESDLQDNNITLESIVDIKNVETITSSIKDIEEIKKKCAYMQAGQYYCILTQSSNANKIWFGTSDDIVDDDYNYIDIENVNNTPIQIKDTNYVILYVNIQANSWISSKIK